MVVGKAEGKKHIILGEVLPTKSGSVHICGTLPSHAQFANALAQISWSWPFVFCCQMPGCPTDRHHANRGSAAGHAVAMWLGFCTYHSPPIFILEFRVTLLFFHIFVFIIHEDVDTAPSNSEANESTP
jgi:hypothetical protein